MKNLLYIFADQWRAHAVGYANQDNVTTPNIDKFASDGMILNNAISTYPLCSPHRAALLTGKYPYSCGVWTNCKIGLDETVMLKPQETTIAKVLKQYNYETGYIGKWHLDASELNFNNKPESGAANWDAYTPPGERRQGFDFWYSYGAMDKHMDPHYWQNTPDKITPKKWSVDHETDIALEFLDNRNKENPFCLFLSWNPPHSPYDKLPEKYKNMDFDINWRRNVPDSFRHDDDFIKTINNYFGAVAGIDENFGRITDYLAENNLIDDTVIVLSADHGDMMGSHGLMAKNIWYEEAINIPFVVKGKDIPKGKSDILFSSVDHMPTLLKLLDNDIEIPSSVQGTDLSNEILGKKQDNTEDVFLSVIQGSADGVKEYQKLGLSSKCYGFRGLRTKTHTYIIDNGTHPSHKQKRFIYDNISDPYQLNPIYLEANDDKAIKYDNRIRQYLELTKDPFIIS